MFLAKRISASRPVLRQNAENPTLVKVSRKIPLDVQILISYNEPYRTIDDSICLEALAMLHKRSLLLFQLPAARRHFLNTLATYLLVVALSAFAFWPMAHTMRDAVQSARLDARKGNSTAALAHLERQIQTIQDAFLYLSSQKGFDRVFCLLFDGQFKEARSFLHRHAVIQ